MVLKALRAAPALFSMVHHEMGFLELDAFAASVRPELYTVGLECFTDRSHGVLVRLAYLAFKVANCPDADASLLFQLGLGPLKECPCGAALRRRDTHGADLGILHIAR
jgi:hypothetical protein